MVLHGPGSSGKSHLAAIWAERSEANLVSFGALSDHDSLNPSGPVVVDDIDANGDARRLFHLLNAAQARRVSLVLTAAMPPAAWASGLADLDSRLRALPSVGLEQPDDALLSAIAVKMFSDRQITVSDAVLTFMLSRLERSCAAVTAAVAALDEAALAQKRPVTVPLARQILPPLNPD